MRKAIKVYNMRIAGELMFKGHMLLGVVPNPENNKKHVFMFLESEDLNKELSEIINRIRR